MSQNVKNALLSLSCFCLAIVFLFGAIVDEAGGLSGIAMVLCMAGFAVAAGIFLLRIKEHVH